MRRIIVCIIYTLGSTKNLLLCTVVIEINVVSLFSPMKEDVGSMILRVLNALLSSFVIVQVHH